MVRLEWDGKSAEAPPPTSLVHTATVVPKGGSSGQPKNRLILGENLAAMAAIMGEFEGKLDLIYADPPFLTGRGYRARAGRGEDSRQPQGWKMVEGFNDSWTDRAEYLNMLYNRLLLMHRLLSDTGTLYLHLDWHAAAYARLLLDEVFGPDRMLNEIIWTYHGPSPIRSAFKRKHDTIYVYTKSAAYTFNADAVRIPYDPATVRTFESSKAGFGKRPDLERGKVPEDWWYFPVVARLHRERTGYPTQKPEALLERILQASSNPGDSVADFFCGAGTTAIVAGRLGRQWLACDISSLAINTTRRRLLLEPATESFEVWMAQDAQEASGLQPRIEVSADNLAVEARLVELNQDELTAVELDWDFDGRLFRSMAQSVRGWRQDRIETRLAHSYAEPGEYLIAAWAVDVSGQVGLATERVIVG